VFSVLSVVIFLVLTLGEFDSGARLGGELGKLARKNAEAQRGKEQLN
jgi:hypothetical protein